MFLGGIKYKYFVEDYQPYEEECLEILEYRGIGFYPYTREIEIVILLLKQNYENDKNVSKIDINKLSGCKIPFAKEIILNIDNDSSSNTYATYVVNTDREENIKNYDYNNHLINKAEINVHIIPDEDGTFNDSRYRQVIAHELIHLRDDYEIRKATDNDINIARQFSSEYLDNALIQQEAHRNPMAYLIYRLFIDTEIHALGSLMYVDMYNLYKQNNYKLLRSSSAKDIKNTETMLEYWILKDQYKNVIESNPFFENFAIKFFPKHLNSYLKIKNVELKKKFKLQFRQWFKNIVKKRLNNVLNRITKAAGTFYDDIEDNKQLFTTDNIINERLLILNHINESYNTVMGLNIDTNSIDIPQDEIINVILYNQYNIPVSFTVKYNEVLNN